MAAAELPPPNAPNFGIDPCMLRPEGLEILIWAKLRLISLSSS